MDKSKFTRKIQTILLVCSGYPEEIEKSIIDFGHQTARPSALGHSHDALASKEYANAYQYFATTLPLAAAALGSLCGMDYTPCFIP